MQSPKDIKKQYPPQLQSGVLIFVYAFSVCVVGRGIN